MSLVERLPKSPLRNIQIRIFFVSVCTVICMLLTYFSVVMRINPANVEGWNLYHISGLRDSIMYISAFSIPGVALMGAATLYSLHWYCRVFAKSRYPIVCWLILLAGDIITAIASIWMPFMLSIWDVFNPTNGYIVCTLVTTLSWSCLFFAHYTILPWSGASHRPSLAVYQRLPRDSCDGGENDEVRPDVGDSGGDADEDVRSSIFDNHLRGEDLDVPVKQLVGKHVSPKHWNLGTWISFCIGLLFCVGLVVMIFYFLYGFCITENPWGMSTHYTRMKKPPLCDPQSDEPCYVYLTMPEDMSTQMIVNFVAGKKLKDVSVQYGAVSEVSAILSYAPAVYTVLETIEDTKYIYSAALTDLKPGTLYTFAVQIQGKISLKTHFHFRTLDKSNEHSAIWWAGGDMGTSEVGQRIIFQVGDSDTDFFVIAGDIAYANNFRGCSCRWDETFLMLQRLTVTPDRRMIPLLTAVGNHEAGGFGMGTSAPIFYYRFFMHRVEEVLNRIDPANRLPYHIHRIRNDSVVIVLDSGHTIDPEGAQLAFLESELASLTADVKYRIAIYHMPMYQVHGDTRFRGMLQAMARTWHPLFDKYGVKLVLENHMHSFVELEPVSAGSANTGYMPIPTTDGTLFLGAGALGTTPESHYWHDVWKREVAENFIYRVKLPSMTEETTEEYNAHRATISAVRADQSVLDTWEIPISKDLLEG
eukprot:Clim_evm83s210 gene=Clim_evmTU83s210